MCCVTAAPVLQSEVNGSRSRDPEVCSAKRQANEEITREHSATIFAKTTPKRSAVLRRVLTSIHVGELCKHGNRCCLQVLVRAPVTTTCGTRFGADSTGDEQTYDRKAKRIGTASGYCAVGKFTERRPNLLSLIMTTFDTHQLAYAGVVPRQMQSCRDLTSLSRS